MRLTRYTDYGLRVLMYLATRPKEVVPTEQIASAFGISLHHLHKVVQQLRDLGWLEARRGPTGGVCFVPASRDLSIGEVVRQLESQIDLVECFDEDTNSCPITPACRLVPIFDDARDAFLGELDKHTIGDVTRRPGELRALLPVGPEAKRRAAR